LPSAFTLHIVGDSLIIVVRDQQSEPLVLSALELNKALNACIKLVQTVTFAREVSDLMKGSKLSSKSNIKDLNPIIDVTPYPARGKT
jgi:hypothetical protein